MKWQTCGVVCVLRLRVGIQIKFPSLLEWSGCVRECVGGKSVLHGAWLCVIKTQRGHRGKMRTGIKMGIGICGQKRSRCHSHPHSHTWSVTLATSHTFFC